MPTTTRVVGNHMLSGFLPFSHKIPVLPYLQERGELTKTLLRDVARFCFPLRTSFPCSATMSGKLSGLDDGKPYNQ